MTYIIYLWPGSGYGLIPFEVIAYSEEQALELVSKYIIDHKLTNFFEEEDEFIDDEEAYEYGYIYVDGTMEGADRPIWLRVENMKIYTV